MFNNDNQNKISLFSKTYKIPHGIQTIGGDKFEDYSNARCVIIPDSVEEIGPVTFAGCTKLTSVVIPDSVTSIGDHAFRGCTGLTSITIPNSVTSIGKGAFQGCPGLIDITIPGSVTSIGTYAFNNCYGMRYYDFSSCTAIPALSNKNAFNNIPSDCQMLIPSALYNNWKSATNWATYASKMVSV